ncbi:CBS domain-containing protein [Lujinxingia vulgaris]|uniref:CBS domain-containing protein n=1 Tax=Lujinxingia vulgaris TaxID=2600176 RepID=A0A5C6X270_9DELT|nr:CBS domain-containing protein [Lujinxingia vulgaris]TXD34378.1 CBS domain-containing protein [Lujinxingia vulgaris]
MIEASELMTGNPERADVTDPLREVIRKLIELDVRHLPIVENNELVGMISDRDLQGLMVPDGSDLEVMRLSDTRFDQPISSVMQGDVISVHPETDVNEVIELMIDQKIGAVPVVDPITGALVGIVSYVDVIRHARDYFSGEESATL